jgi:hypothetical protein
MRTLAKLWDDDGGALLTTEWVLLVTVLVLGVAIGFFAVRQVILTQVVDMTNHSPSGTASHGAGQLDVEAATEGPAFKGAGAGAPIVVKSTAAVPGGIDNRSCD